MGNFHFLLSKKQIKDFKKTCCKIFTKQFIIQRMHCCACHIILRIIRQPVHFFLVNTITVAKSFYINFDVRITILIKLQIFMHFQFLSNLISSALYVQPLNIIIDISSNEMHNFILSIHKKLYKVHSILHCFG